MATTTTMSAGGRYGYRQMLAVGEFRAILAAHVISFSGDVIAQLALAVLVFERTGSALGSSLTFASRSAFCRTCWAARCCRRSPTASPCGAR